MDDKEPLRVDSELYVNQATLELLRRQIESEVKGGFFRWIGLPIGGAGVVAILLTVFVWIPDKIEKMAKEQSVSHRTNHYNSSGRTVRTMGNSGIPLRVNTEIRKTV